MNPLIYNHPEQWTLLFITTLNSEPPHPLPPWTVNLLIYNHPEQWTLLFITTLNSVNTLIYNHSEWWTSSSITTQNNKYLTHHHPEQWTPLSSTTQQTVCLHLNNNPLIHHYPTNCLSSPEQWTPHPTLPLTTNCLSSPEQWTPYPTLPLTTNCLSSPEQWTPLSITTLNNKLFVFTWTMNPLIQHHQNTEPSYWLFSTSLKSSTWLWLQYLAMTNRSVLPQTLLAVLFWILFRHL